MMNKGTIPSFENVTSRAMMACGIVLAGLGVLLGAFGAHWLESYLPEKFPNVDHRLESWRTAVNYQLVHAIGLLVLGSSDRLRGGWKRAAGAAMFGGVILFSGSLYGWVVADQKWLAMVVPIGGLAFVFAWIASFVALRPRNGDLVRGG